MDKLKWGIIGTGGIARRFAEALGASETGTLYAVGSRAQETADAFGESFDVPVRYASYDDLLADDEVDAIYNSLPNHLHLQWTTKAAQAGKHVLCEKPLTVNTAEAEQMFAAARKADVFLMEGFMYRCHPQTSKLVELIRDGAIGQVRVIQATFCYDMGDSDQAYRNIRLRNDVAGGGIMDVGCYTASMARLVAGAALGMPGSAEPERLEGVAHIGQRGRVDEWAAAVIQFPNDVIANLICAPRVQVTTGVHIWGSEGHISVPDPWFAREGKLVLQRRGADVEEIVTPSEVNCYTLETDVVARNLSARQAPYPCMTWADSLGNMRTLDQWRASVGLVFDVEKG